MIPLNDRELLTLWTEAQPLPPQWRGAALAAHAAPQLSAADAASLPIARRDALLLELRERCFGNLMTALASCPDCGTRVEISFEMRDLRGHASTDERLTVSVDEFEVEARLPTTRDLAAAASEASVNDAAERLLERCVVAARRAGEPVEAAELTPAVRDAVAAKMEEAGAAGDAEISMSCPECGRAWSALFDAPAFLWSELNAAALRVFDDVHALATAYGWSEEAIVSMPRARRRVYRELV